MYVALTILRFVYENLLSAFCVICIALVYNWWKHPHTKFPPGVRGYPIIGALPFLGKYPEKVIAKWSREKYGPVMSVRFGSKDLVFINTYDMLYQAYINDNLKYLDRPDMPIMNPIYKNIGFSFRPADSEWRIQRNFVRSKLTRHGLGNIDMEVRINQIIKDLLYLIEEENKEPFNIANHFGWALAANIVSLCFGKKPERYDERMMRLVDHVKNLFSDSKTSQSINAMMIFPSLKILPQYKKAAEEFYRRANEMLEYVDEEIAIKKESCSNDNVTDYVEACWQETKLRNGADGFTSEQLRLAVYEFIFAGTDTGSLTLSWGLLCLLHYPHTQKKLHQEINSVLGKYEKPSMNHVSSLPYTMAFLQELYRFRIIAPFSNQRRVNQTVQLGGYVIPKNTAVAPNLWAIHNDPELWEEPEVFKPERHLDEEGKFVYSKKIIPFSIGGRSCPGEKFARMEIFLIWVNLLKNFEFSPDPECEDLPEISDGINGFLYCPFPFKVVAKPLH